MQEFYNKALITFLGLLSLSILVAILCLDSTYLHFPLTPANKSDISWKSEAMSDASQGGSSSVAIIDDQYSLSFEFTIQRTVDHPFAMASVVFTDQQGQVKLIDLSQYDSISFSSKCYPSVTLSLSVLTFDETISTLGDYVTYRGPSAFFSCNENRKDVELDLTRLETPQWWFDMFKLDLSQQDYSLDKVPKISFTSTFQSHSDLKTSVQLGDISLHGRDWRYLYLLCGLMIVIWGSYLFWLFRQHTKTLIVDLQDKIQKDRPLIAYQQLSVEPHGDKEKTSILRFMATEYANPDLDLETMVSTLGINRTKINDILKSELGFTFSTYLNKLRLTEASRLLSVVDEVNIAQIAYSVGYKNVSYFNKLFKEEYGCTPKTFKNLCGK